MWKMNERLWYKDAIIYGIDLAYFQDGNGDGTGDLEGATRRLAYLRNLGINCVWLLPFYPSPLRDNGYDIEDYYDVGSQFGTLADFVGFVHEAGEFGIRVITDLVVNHTSDQHPWFQAARSDASSRFRDYYVWSGDPPVGAGPENVFPGQEDAVWTYDELAHAYYYHRFYHFEPQLNFANREVVDEVFRIMDLWLSFGIAGFRMDAAAHVVQAANLQAEVPQAPHSILKEVRQFLETRRPGGILLGESDVKATSLEDYFGQGDEINMLFNFLLTNYLFLILAEGRKDAMEYALGLLPSVPHSGHWVNFLRNLDELDLERLPEDQRQTVMDALDPEHKARIFGRGLRRRFAPLMGGDQRRIRMAYSVMFSMPGSPCLVYGDEIGMGDNLSRPGRDAVRTPMQWSGERNAGFSDSMHLPVSPISEGPFAYQHVNVARQEEDPDSLLNWMRQLILTRRRCPEFGWGPISIVSTSHPAVLAHRCEWQGGHVMVVHNLSAQEQDCVLDLLHQRHGDFHPLFGNTDFHLQDHGHLAIRLPPYGYQWIREGQEQSREI